MHILERIKRLKTALQEMKANPQASHEVITVLAERIAELEARTGCSCSQAKSQTPQQIKENFDNLKASAILANAKVTQCPLHGPVIPAREIEKEKEL